MSIFSKEIRLMKAKIQQIKFESQEIELIKSRDKIIEDQVTQIGGIL